MFDRLGAETKADTTTGNKVSWKWESHWELSKSCLPQVSFLTLATSHLPFQPQFFALVAFLSVFCPNLSHSQPQGSG